MNMIIQIYFQDIQMNNEFLDLYNKWRNTFIFSAHGSADPKSKESYEELRKWALENKNEFKSSAIELLEEGPNDIVMLLNDIFDFEVEGWMPLDIICNIWINLYKGTINVDYYKDYREFHEYMKDHYIPWNPFHEEDPNITLEEFKQGKRNKI